MTDFPTDMTCDYYLYDPCGCKVPCKETTSKWSLTKVHQTAQKTFQEICPLCGNDFLKRVTVEHLPLYEKALISSRGKKTPLSFKEKKRIPSLAGTVNKNSTRHNRHGSVPFKYLNIRKPDNDKHKDNNGSTGAALPGIAANRKSAYVVQSSKVPPELLKDEYPCAKPHLCFRTTTSKKTFVLALGFFVAFNIVAFHLYSGE